MTHLMFIYVVACVSSLFHITAKQISLYEYTPVCLYILNEGHLSCVQFLVIMNKATINFHARCLDEFKLVSLLGKSLGVGLLNYVLSTVFV